MSPLSRRGLFAPAARASVFRRGVLLLALATTLGCADSTGPRNQSTVSIVTAGAAFDADGYTLLVDGKPWLTGLPPNSTSMLARNWRVPVTVEITDVADNCSVQDGSVRTIATRSTGDLVFSLRCNPPDELAGARLLLVRATLSGRRDLHWLDLDGSASTPLTTDGASSDPAVSKQGEIAFTRATGQPSRSAIHSMSLSGSEPVLLTTGGSEFKPTWAPDGRRFAYVVGGWWPIVVVASRDSEERTELTHFLDGSSSDDPAWSPDGSRVAFALFGPDGTGGIFAWRADGSGMVQLSTDGISPVWSPESDRIAYYHPPRLNQPGQLRIIAADGSGSIEFAFDLDQRGLPSDWSVDGRWVLFTSSAGLITPTYGRGDVYLADLFTSRLYRITADGLSHSAVFAVQPGS